MHTRLALLTVLMALLISGCNPQPLPVAPTPIPTLIPATLPVEATAAPATGDEGRSEGAGAKVFDASCSVCHNLNTETKVGPGLAGLFAKDTLPNGNPVNDETLKEWIRNGGGAMPGVSLADDQLEMLIVFLMEATRTAGGEDVAARAGAQVFEEACAVCHNLTSQAKVGPGLAGIFSQGTLPNGSPVTDENLTAWIRSGGGAMPGIPLLDDQLQVLIAFLRGATQ